MSDETITCDFGAGAEPTLPRGAKTRLRRAAPGERAGTRRENDAYDTDPACALACVQMIADRGWLHVADHRAPLAILDPTAGKGPFVAAARKVFRKDSRIGACDVRPECEAPCRAAGADSFLYGDVLAVGGEVISRFDLIATNPPFKLADELVRFFWTNMKEGAVLAFLLNLTFLGSSERWEEPGGLFTIAPPRFVLPIVPRPSFITVDGKPKSAMFEAGLFVWAKGWSGVPSIPGPLRWEKGAK